VRSLRWLWPPFLVGTLLLLPWLLFLLQPERRLAVVVVDKTVPYRNYLEHRGLFRLLEQLKVRRPDGAPYRYDADYVGVTPGERPGDRPRGMTPLDEATALGAQLLYLTDTYGVYEEDLVSGPPMLAALERSRKIYGGLEPDEARAVEGAWRAGRTVVAEFNTMASPTGEEARAVLEQVGGVRWTHWIGRYFPALDDESEVPQWLRSVWEREWGRPWQFHGPGHVLTRDDVHCEVLRVDDEAPTNALRVDRAEPLDPLLARALDRTPYPFWWEWVEPQEGTEVLAWYVWELNPAGRKRLAERGIPLRMAAVTRHRGAGSGVAYYFAGDFADGTVAPEPVPLAGFLTVRRLVERGRRVNDQHAFYYRFYAPLVQAIVEAQPAAR